MKRPAIKRLTKAERQEQLELEMKMAYNRGKAHGIDETRKEMEADIRIQIRKSNIQLAQSLGQMVEATARAVVALTENLHG